MPIGAADAIAVAADRRYLTSGMDLSDGVIEFLYTIQRRSGLGCVIDYSALPASEPCKRNLSLLAEILNPQAMSALRRDPNLIAFEPGYDSALRHAFTIPSGFVDDAKTVFKAHGSELHVIGETTREPGVRLRRGGSNTEIPAFWDDKLRHESVLQAWNSFLEEML
jgi:thiamine monophosphate kinase